MMSTVRRSGLIDQREQPSVRVDGNELVARLSGHARPDIEFRERNHSPEIYYCSRELTDVVPRRAALLVHVAAQFRYAEFRSNA